MLSSTLTGAMMCINLCHSRVIERYFKGDKWNRALGSRIPIGSLVKVINFYPKRRVIVEYRGEQILTMLWCLSKTPL